MEVAGEVNGWIDRIESLMKRCPKQPAPHICGFDGGRHPFHVVFGSIVHGDEVGSLPAFAHFLEEFLSGALSFGGRVSFFLGNVPAARRGLRFIDCDLNRVFGEVPGKGCELERAAQLKPLLQDADLFVDFHQTRQDSVTPFFTFEFRRSSYFWARLSGGAPVLITRHPRARFSATELCADEFVRSRGAAAFTLELGKKGFFAEAAKMTSLVMNRVLVAADSLSRGGRTLEGLARKNRDLSFLRYVYREPASIPVPQLLPGLINLQRIAKDEPIGTRHDGSLLCAPESGYLLFPKYPDKLSAGLAMPPVSGDMFMLACELEKHPFRLYDCK